MPTATWTRIVIFLATVVWLIASLVMDLPVDGELLRPLGIVASVVVLALLGFEVFIWRWLPIQLVKVPNLRGTWRANLRSNYIGDDGKSINLTCFLVIRQSYSRINIEILYPKSESFSTSAAVLHTDGTAELWYSYRSEAHSLDRQDNPPHKGAVHMRISVGENLRMAGDYWTDRQTFGRIETVARKQQVISDYSEALTSFGLDPA